MSLWLIRVNFVYNFCLDVGKSIQHLKMITCKIQVLEIITCKIYVQSYFSLKSEDKVYHDNII